MFFSGALIYTLQSMFMCAVFSEGQKGSTQMNLSTEIVSIHMNMACTTTSGNNEKVSYRNAIPEDNYYPVRDKLTQII